MKKAILVLWGLICVLFFASCNKEQMKPAAEASNKTPVQVQTTSRMEVNGKAIVNPTTPPQPKPKSDGAGIVIPKTPPQPKPKINGKAIVNPTTPPQP